jgi:hypothetical protein
MKISLFAISAFLLATTQAATVTFNVISPDSKSVAVEVNGKRTELKAPKSNVPYYSGSVDVGSATSYKYVADNKGESFNRNISSGTEKTFNEFYGRPITYNNLPALPRPLDNDKQWTRADSDPRIFDINYIPTVFVNGDQKEMDNLVHNLKKDKYPVELTLIGKDYVETYNNVTWFIYGAGKKKNPAKQSWGWNMSPGDYIDHRDQFKARHMEEDPTQMREKLYADCLRAMGTYANEANMLRIFINGEGFGTFNLLDNTQTYSYIRSMFYGGNPPSKMGPLYDGSTGAGFQYIEDPYDYGSFQPVDGSPEGSEAIYPLAKAFNQTNVKDDKSIAAFNETFDIDQYMRFMVMEYLTGSWDAYWMMQTNDGAYKDYANNNTWYYLGQDYDATFGINMAEDVMNLSYTQYPPKYTGAVLINGFLQNDKLHDTFQNYLIDTVKTLFNNNTLGKHITAYHDFLAPDLKWDRSIKQESDGTNFGWAYNQTYINMFEGVDAPNKNGGGAEYGLTEWIYKKSNIVAKEFNFKI